MKLKLMMAGLLVALTLTGCGAKDKEDAQIEKSTSRITAPNTFLYDSTQKVAVKLTGGAPKSTANVYTVAPELEGSIFLTTIEFNEEGVYEGEISISPVTTKKKSLYLRSNYITMKSVTVEVDTENDKIEFDYKAKKENIKAAGKRYLSNNLSGHLAKYDGTNEITWDSNGKVSPITNVTVPKPLIDTLNARFPERQIHRDGEGRVYMDQVTSDKFIRVSDGEKDVKVTVIHEGAGYFNTIAYYVYPADDSLLTKEYIKNNAKLIFPNFTINDVLNPGDTVSIGKFPAGTRIGFAVLSNKWAKLGGNNTPNWNAVWDLNDKETFVTTSKLNKDKKQHTVMYNYELSKGNTITIIGMEDLLYSNSDKDFNDMMIYVNQKSNGETINTSKTTTVYTDLVTYYPSEEGVNSLVYEDLWPEMGDYDFNDQVINVNYKTSGVQKTVTTYYYTTVKETDIYGQVKETTTLTDTKVEKTSILNSLELTYELKAVGAGYISGFGIEVGIAKDKIASVTGQKFLTSNITNDANGVESGNGNSSVVIVYDNAKHLLTNGVNEIYVNTTKNGIVYPTVKNKVVVTFKEGTTFEDLTNKAPYNPFIFRNTDKKSRGIEVHLPGKKPTAFANAALFSTLDDGTVIDSKYYLSKITLANGNLPWALEIPGNFKYPVERMDISKAYPKFFDWAVSGGTVNEDWYNFGDASKLY